MPASRPYSGETIDDLLRAHRRDPIPSLPGVGPLFARMVAKKPADRFANLAEVLAGIDALKRSPTRRALLLTVGGVALAGYVLWPRSEPTPTRLPFDGRAEQQRWASILKRPIEMTNDLDMKLMLIPPGESGHGAFYLGATEVTIGQFRRFVESSRPRYITQAEQDTGWGWQRERGWHRGRFSWQNTGDLVLTPEHPVVNIARDDAEVFCRWLTARTGAVYRLPTEAEWEFACRAGSAGAWCFGDDPAHLALYAWMADDSEDSPQPVGRKRANGFGLFDVHGNLLEWCRSEEGVARGGSFRSRADGTRCDERKLFEKHEVQPGFRVLCEISG